MDYESMTVKDLRQYAADNEIDLGTARNKPDIIAVIQAAVLPPETATGASNDEAGENTTPATESADTGVNDAKEDEETDPPASDETPPEENAENVTETITKDAPPEAGETPPEDDEPQNPPALFTLDRVLRVGKPLMRGTDIKAIQAALISKGYHVGAGGADGVYARDTAQAVRHFQAANGFVVNGRVGSQTAAALGAAWKGK